MKKIRAPRRITILLAVAAAAIIIPIAAFAYFTTTGSGTGSASVGSASAVKLSNTAADVGGTLYPDGADVPITVLVENPGDGAQYVGTVSGTVQDDGACLGSWFVIDDVDVKATIAKGASTTATTAVRMLDSNTNQNSCQGKTLTIDWTSTAAS